jgi:hypothetical protein
MFTGDAIDLRIDLQVGGEQCEQRKTKPLLHASIFPLRFASTI